MSNGGPAAVDGASAATSYPRTRSQTRSLPALKRKGSDLVQSNPPKSAKIARTEPARYATLSEDLSPEAAVDPLLGALALSPATRTMWPPDVPRSMLFTFRAGPSTFQMYKGVDKTSTASVPPPSDAPQFLATGSEPMFDHSWRVAFVESAHTPKRQTDAVPTSHPSRIPSKKPNAAAYIPSHPPSTPARSTRITPNVGSVLRASGCGGRLRDENAYNAAPSLELVHVEVPKHMSDVSLPKRSPPTPLSPSNSLTQNHPVDLLSFASPSTRLRPPVPLMASDGRLAPITERIPSPEDTTIAYPPTPSRGPSLLFHGVASNLDPLAPSFGPHPMYAHRPISVHPAQPYPPMGSYTQARPEPHIPMFPLPPHPGLYLNHSRPQHIPSGYVHPVHTPAVPFAWPPRVSHGVSVAYADQASRAPPHVFHSPSDGIPHGTTPPITLGPPVARLPPSKWSSGPSAPWSMFYECIKNGRKALRGTGKRRRRIEGSADEHPQARVVDGDLSRLQAAADARMMGPLQSHRCPFCPRTFPLANGLAIHLKWHWGASGLEWKRGISRTGKTIDRALRDAERRREEAARLQDERDFPGIPPSVSTSCSPPRTSSNRQSPMSSSSSNGYPFTMPIMAQATFNVFDFPVYSSQTCTTSESSCTSPTDGQPPHMFYPPVVAAPSAAYNSFPHTPELLTDSGSTNGASTGRSSPTWSENLFGYEDEDADAEGEIDEDDLFGDHLVPRGAPQEASCGTGTDVGSGSAVRTSTSACDERSKTREDGHSWEGGLMVAGRRRAASVRVRPPFLRAPRLVPLRLPTAFFDDDEEDERSGGEGSGNDDENNGGDNDDPFAVRGLSSSRDGLAPLHGLPPLQALPELDAAFQNLSVF